MGKKILYTIFVVTLASILTARAATVLKLPGGGLGHSTSTKGDLFVGNNTTSLGRVPVGADGLVLKASSGAAFGVAYETDSSGGGGVETSTVGAYAAGSIAFFVSTSTISATSGLQVVSSTGFVTIAGNLNSSGTITQSGLVFIVSSTFWALTPGGDLGGTWDVPSVDDNSHAHDATTVSGLSTADFTSANISNWTNDAGYTTLRLGRPVDGGSIRDNQYRIFLASPH